MAKMLAMPRHRFTSDTARAAGRIGGAKPKSFRGKTWEEIYGPEVAAKKRAQIASINKGKHLSAETRAKVSESKRRGIAEGRIKVEGRPHTEATKRRISERRVEAFGCEPGILVAVRQTKRYREFKRAVLDRDGFACQSCGTREPERPTARKTWTLEIHHQVELWRLVAGLSLEQAMESPEVWDIANAVTLCRPCHQAIPVMQP